MISAFFVYGTLMRGQVRQSLWPAQPLAVSAGWVHGTLYGRADYPAMTDGPDRVVGELWTFRDADVPPVTRTLDDIEGTNRLGQPDLYRRVIVPVFGAGDGQQAYAYRYARDPVADHFVRLGSDRQGFVRWPPPPTV